MKRQWSGTDKIKFYILPKTSNGKENGIQYNTRQVKKTREKLLPSHQAILNKRSKMLSTNRQNGQTITMELRHELHVARVMKLHIKKLEILHYLGSEQQRR